jgi:hypothetical protein
MLRPLAMRNNSRPYCTPFKVWIRKNNQSMAQYLFLPGGRI